MYLNVSFTISGSANFDGTYLATLAFAKSVVTGTIADAGGFPCTVSSGSTDKQGKLMLTCSVLNGLDIITLIGCESSIAHRNNLRFCPDYDTAFCIPRPPH
jgi:hypothetical protein